MAYDPIPYWLARGANYESRFKPERYADQEAAIAAVLDELDFESVLEVGCGFGRIGSIVKGLRPDVRYVGIDISPDLINSARTRVPDGTFFGSTLADFDTPDRFDLVIAAEVLMHIPPADVAQAVRKLTRLTGRYLVTVDWTEPVAGAGPHNFLHDYRRLMPSATGFLVGQQTIHVWTAS